MWKSSEFADFETTYALLNDPGPVFDEARIKGEKLRRGLFASGIARSKGPPKDIPVRR